MEKVGHFWHVFPINGYYFQEFFHLVEEVFHQGGTEGGFSIGLGGGYEVNMDLTRRRYKIFGFFWILFRGFF